MDPVQDAWTRWRYIMGDEPNADISREALDIVDDFSNFDAWTTARIIETGALLWETEPHALTDLSETSALYLAESFIVNYRVSSKDPDVIATDLRAEITGIFETEREAASAAVRYLGGARVIHISTWQEMALREPNCPESVIDTAKLAAANSAPGIGWHYVPDLGYVTYRLS